MDEDIRRRVLRRYQAMGAGQRRPSRHEFRFQFQRLIWMAFVGGAKAAKRTVDIVGSVLLLFALSPFFAVIAVFIKFESPGPVLFKQIRVGKWGQTFGMYKFRSMYQDAERRREALEAQNEVPGGVIFKLKRDPRITRIGRFIRRRSIDELPQLLNVLAGEMSLVGPRPAIPSEVSLYTLADRQRLDVPPGITCIWQVSGRSEIPFDKQVELDIAYIEAQSLWLDMKLMLKTVPAVLSGRGAY